MKKCLCLILCGILTLALLGGCAATPGGETTAPTAASTAPATTAPTTVPETTVPATTAPVETVPPTTVHTHVYEAVVTAPNCTDQGFTTHTCACGDRYTDGETAALGHEYEMTVVAPTTESQGYNLHTCKRCGHSYQDGFIPKVELETTPPRGNEVMHFFDDAAFIGDSVTLKLQYYQAEYGLFGSATFLTAGSYSVNHAVNGTMFLTYRGQQMSPEDALAACGAKKVFILLGMNDIALTGVDKAIENWGVLIQRIRAKNPDIVIYIQSGTPIFIGGEKGGLNNNRMNQYNERLKVFAAQNGCYYVDIATAMKDSNGGLRAAYCSDKFVHLTYAGCDAWTAVLRNYVGG